MMFLMSMFGVQSAHANQQFADIPTSHVAYDEIMYLYSLDVIKGYTENGKTYYKPQNTLTRAQAAKMLVITSGNTPLKVSKSSFTDVNVRYEASGYIERAVQLGMISGVTQSKFEPNKPMTRDLMAKGLSVAFDLDANEYANIEIPFTDINQSNGYYKYVAALYYNGVTEGNGNKFMPANNVTRAQFARFIARAKTEKYRLSLPVQGSASDVIMQVVVNTNGLNIRSSAVFTGSSNIAGQVNKGYTFNVYEETSSYYKVSYNGRYGYIYKQYVDKVTGNTGGSTTPTPTPIPTPTPKPEPTPAPAVKTIGFATVNSLNIRSQANASSAIVATVNRGAQVNVESITGQWAKVTYNGKTGYINKTYLRLKNTSGSVLKDRIIVVDPGHGGKDPGAVSGSVLEKQIVLKVSQKLQQKLQAAGAAVKMTRTGDTFPSLADRTNFAVRNYGEVFVSIHTNAGPTAASGTETFYSTADNAQEEAILAKYINDEIVKNAGMKDRSVKKAEYYVIHNIYMPAVLVELGFISNSEDRAKLVSDQYAEIYAQSIYNGILKYYQQ